MGLRRFDPERASREVARLLGVGTDDLPERAPTLARIIRGKAAFGGTGPVRPFGALLGDQWSTLILHVIRLGAFRYTTIQHIVNAISEDHPISQRILSLKLRNLERDGLLERRVLEQFPPHVTYRLTDLGEDFLQQALRLADWVLTNMARIEAAHARFSEAYPELEGLGQHETPTAENV